jgi:hypothetical protein
MRIGFEFDGANFDTGSGTGLILQVQYVFDVVFAIFLFVDLDPHSERRIWIQRRM